MHFVSDNRHPVALYHYGSRLFLIKEGRNRELTCETAHLFRQEARRIFPVVTASLGELQQTPPSIEFVRQLFEQGYRPRLRNDEVCLVRPFEDDSARIIRYIDQEIMRLSTRLNGERLPDGMLCPIHFVPLVDPYITEFGQTYERAYIQSIYQRDDPGRRICPVSGGLMTRHPTPNGALRETIDSYLSRSPIPLLPAMRGQASANNSIGGAKHKGNAEELLDEPRSPVTLRTIENYLDSSFIAYESYENFSFLAGVYLGYGEHDKAALTYLRLARLQIERGQFDDGVTTFSIGFQIQGDEASDSMVAANALIQKRRGNRDFAFAAFQGLANRCPLGSTRKREYWKAALRCHHGNIPASLRVWYTFMDLIVASDAIRNVQTLGFLYLKSINPEKALEFQSSANLHDPETIPLWASLTFSQANLPHATQLLTIESPEMSGHLFNFVLDIDPGTDLSPYLSSLNGRGGVEAAIEGASSQIERFLHSNPFNFPETITAIDRAVSIVNASPRFSGYLIAAYRRRAELDLEADLYSDLSPLLISLVSRGELAAAEAISFAQIERLLACAPFNFPATEAVIRRAIPICGESTALLRYLFDAYHKELSSNPDEFRRIGSQLGVRYEGEGNVEAEIEVYMLVDGRINDYKSAIRSAKSVAKVDRADAIHRLYSLSSRALSDPEEKEAGYPKVVDCIHEIQAISRSEPLSNFVSHDIVSAIQAQMVIVELCQKIERYEGQISRLSGLFSRKNIDISPSGIRGSSSSSSHSRR